MIHANRIVTVGEQESIIDRPIVLYRGDREVEIEFTLVGNEFTFSEEGNVIKSVNASHGQLVLNTPSGEHMFSELAECHEGKVVFVVTKEMIDEFIEMGFYSFQIRLYDSAEMKSRVTIPPVMNGFDIRNPIAAEDETNVVDQGIVDYARIFKDQSNEELPTFDWTGAYNKTEWVHHDVITENKLNKIEDALYSINANVKESDVVMLNTLDQVKKDADAYVKEHIAEVEADVAEFERNLNTDVQKFKVDTNAAMTAHKNEVSEVVDGFDSQLTDNTNNLSILNKEKINILSYSDYVIDGNWTEAIKKALEEAENSNCKIVYFPCGTYNVNPDSIIVPNDVSLVGASETNSIIKGPGRTNLGAGIQLGIRCTVSNLYIRDFEIGIKNTKYWNKIYDCKIYNNIIGIQLNDSYICKIKNNEITFNGIGLIIAREAYECIIKGNIIDNNNLGLGIYGSSNGLIISDNTIEGNRNNTTSVGCGILLKGANHSRCKISGNWFESNGSTQDSIDVFLGAANDTYHATAITLWNNIVDNCVPDNYKSLLSAGGLAVGAIDLSNNAHIFTKYGVLAGGYKVNIHIHDCYFKGTLDRYNKHVVITNLSSHLDVFTMNIDNCNAENSDGMTTITPQVLTGIRGTYVHSLADPKSEHSNITFDGEPLFVKKLTLKQVLDKYECIPLQQFNAVGTTTNIPDRFVLLSKQARQVYTTNARYSTSTATVLLGTKGTGDASEVIITPDPDGSYFFTIGLPCARYRYQKADTWLSIPTGMLAKKQILSTGRFYIDSYDGYTNGIFFIVKLTVEQYEKYFKDAYSVEITDAQYFLQGNIPE